MADPADSAGAIIAGMIDGETSIFPDPAARAVESVIGTSVTALEAQFAGLLVE
jgi:hypothetical protein